MCTRLKMRLNADLKEYTELMAPTANFNFDDPREDPEGYISSTVAYLARRESKVFPRLLGAKAVHPSTREGLGLISRTMTSNSWRPADRGC